MSLQSNIYATIGTAMAMGIFFLFKNEENVSVLVARSMEIFNGNDAKEDLFPYQVSLSVDGEHSCGGSILDATTVVTAAHCVMDKIPYLLYAVYKVIGYNLIKPKTIDLSKLEVEAGSVYRGKGSLHAVSQVELHDDFNVISHDWDIAILKIEVPFSFDDHVKPVDLPEMEETIAEGTKAIVSGWGLTKSKDGGLTVAEVLQYAIIPVWSEESCLETFRGKITERMLCAGDQESEKDSYMGDSGGPLVANGKLIGVTSWSEECGSQVVYTKVSSVRKWIDEKVKVQ